jgi:hypothetical protein
MSATREAPSSRATYYRSAAAHVDATRALRQREECCLVGDADLAGSSQLEPAPDCRSVQRCDRGNATTTKQGERCVPCARVVKRLARLPPAVLGEVEAG